jgi:DNA-binding winged helix-turn-helix (wHTH) protein
LRKESSPIGAFPFALRTSLSNIGRVHERPGEVIGREELRSRLCLTAPHVDFDEGVNTAISKLRYALHDSAETPVFVETVPRRGYRFLAPISHVIAVDGALKNGSLANSVAAHTPEPDAKSLSMPDAVSTSTALNRSALVRRRRLAAGLVALVVFVLGSGWVLLRWRTYN